MNDNYEINKYIQETIYYCYYTINNLINADYEFKRYLIIEIIIKENLF